MPKSTLLGQPVVVHYTLLAGRACSFGGEAVSESERAFVVRDAWTSGSLLDGTPVCPGCDPRPLKEVRG